MENSATENTPLTLQELEADFDTILAEARDSAVPTLETLWQEKTVRAAVHIFLTAPDSERMVVRQRLFDKVKNAEADLFDKDSVAASLSKADWEWKKTARVADHMEKFQRNFDLALARRFDGVSKKVSQPDAPSVQPDPIVRESVSSALGNN
ncbi:MAG: hypothetical protein WC843_03605 [Candidatus Gracilibacteria bacterium]|jgi:hypothetical protein